MSTQAHRYAQAMAVTEHARGRAEEERAWLDLLALLDAAAPAPSVVPESAVEAATTAVRRERAFAAAAAFGVPLDAVPQCAEMIARAALTAALPHLTAAAPSATREDVEIGCACGVVISVARYALGLTHNCPECGRPLITRFNITPKED